MKESPEKQGAAMPSPEEVIRQNRRRLRPLPTSVRWLILAGGIVLTFAVCHAMGLREDVSMVFGTGENRTPGGALGGAAYAILYLATIVTCPILAIAAGIHAVLARLANRERPPA